MSGFRMGKWLGLCCCLLLAGGCATESVRTSEVANNPAEIRAQQARLQELDKYYRAGRQYQDAGDFPPAISAYEKVLAIDPDFAEAHNGLGVVLALSGNHEPAIRHLTTAAGLAPLASHIQNNLGYACLLQGNLVDAERAFQQSLQLDPENVQARTNLMTVRQRMRATGG